jgi:hypothetical protein
MNRVILQLWQESNINGEILNDGCSLHISLIERDSYVTYVYKNRGDEIPDKYDRILGDSVEVFVSDSIYEALVKDKSMKIPEPAFQNLLKFEDIIYNKSEI